MLQDSPQTNGALMSNEKVLSMWGESYYCITVVELILYVSSH